jgi:hypothetical protein
MNVVTYRELLSVSLVRRVKLFHVVLRVLNDDLMRIAIEVENNANHVLRPVLNPPRLKAQALDLVLLDQRVIES